MAVLLLYETHSLSEDNERGSATGWLPGRLSAQGRMLARELGERRRNDDIAAVFVSDLARAVETADLAFGGTRIPVFQDERLRECNYGVLNGAPVAQLAAVRARHIDAPFPGGQSYRDVVNAMSGFLNDVVRQWNGHRICVISHSANKWALDCLVHGARLEDLVDAPFGWKEGWEYVVEEA